MKKLILFFCLLCITSMEADPYFNSGSNSAQKITFTENKGQISDQNNKPRTDILFSGNTQEAYYFLRKNGVSYQLNQMHYKENEINQDSYKSNLFQRSAIGMLSNLDKIETYRVDVTWLDCSENISMRAEKVLPGYNNYYLPVCPEGVFGVKSYEEVYYNEIYADINLHFYQKDNLLKYDFIVAPGGNYKQIRLAVNGADRISIQGDGSLLFETPFGKIQDGKPIVFQNGKQLKARWHLAGNIISFEIENYDPRFKLVIDPAVRVWGTYYGGAGYDSGFSCTTDQNGNVYMAGVAQVNSISGIATNGSYQTTFGGGQGDAFLVKFDSNGIRQWATYYGGTWSDWATSCATDNNGDIFVTGGTASEYSIMATPGSHQGGGGGGFDAFLAKFNSSGMRQWSTFYGGYNDDIANSCGTDPNGDVYIAGDTKSSTNIASLGAFQTTTSVLHSDAFLAKFNTNGVRQWGTYYGWSGDESGTCCSADPSGNVYLSGAAAPTNTLFYQSAYVGTVIATIGSHQSSYGGSTGDAFLVKFDSIGNRLWGTYYGGNGHDWGGGCSTDANGNVFLTGYTTSNQSSVIATSGAFQTTYAAGGISVWDAFLVKFNSNGVRQWGTYYGGTNDDVAVHCENDIYGNVYITGFTRSSTVIASSGSHQYVFGGSLDAFLAKFDGSGLRKWGTYYGGLGDERARFCAIDGSGSIYMCGESGAYSGNIIATIGSHQSTGDAYSEGFLVKFKDCAPAQTPTNVTTISNQTICANNSATLEAISDTMAINWFAGITSSVSLATGTIFITSPLSAGIHTFYAEAYGCGPSLIRTPVTITVLAAPSISLNSGAICIGESYTLLPTGSSSYTYSSGPVVVSPTITSSFFVTAVNALGCVDTAVANVIVHPLPVIALNSNSDLICSGESVTLSVSGADTYTWSTGTTYTSEIVSPSVTSTYWVNGIDMNGCLNFATKTIVVDVCTMLSEQDKMDYFLNFYPNPAHDILTLKSDQTSANFIKISISNSLGQVVLEEFIKPRKSSLNVRDLPNGIYTLRMENKNVVQTAKLIKN